MNDQPEEETTDVQPIQLSCIYLKERVDPIGHFLLGMFSWPYYLEGLMSLSHRISDYLLSSNRSQK